MERPIHPDFLKHLEMKEINLIELYADLRNYIIEICPDANELLYHTHALTSVYSLSDKLGDAFCMIPIYSNHLNLGFHQGTLLPDRNQLLQGTGKLIRHIPVKRSSDYKNKGVRKLIDDSIALAKEEMTKPSKLKGQTISKIKN
ncbi:DUF1801 domain-containing protein [Roseivirga sp.]|uniref:DUF1801 domain-containing protein n=1 Tax=Roseivirga sp. TaxID=1964215 RepID=UPI003B516F10